jgi:hypothetical protein
LAAAGRLCPNGRCKSYRGNCRSCKKELHGDTSGVLLLVSTQLLTTSFVRGAEHIRPSLVRVRTKISWHGAELPICLSRKNGAELPATPPPRVGSKAAALAKVGGAFCVFERTRQRRAI